MSLVLASAVVTHCRVRTNLSRDASFAVTNICEICSLVDLETTTAKIIYVSPSAKYTRPLKIIV